MNLNKLPWWKTDYKSNKRMNCDFFEYLNGVYLSDSFSGAKLNNAQDPFELTSQLI